MEQISISSDTFKDGSSLSVEYTCDGEDRSPALSWDTVPAGTQSIALIVDDPDAPGKTWVHWVIYNIPANSSGLPPGVPKNNTLDDGSLQGNNDLAGLAITDHSRRRASPTGISSRYMPWILHLA